MNFQIFKLVLEKAEEPEVKLPISTGSLKKQESSRKKKSISALLTMPNSLQRKKKREKLEEKRKITMKTGVKNKENIKPTNP